MERKTIIIDDEPNMKRHNLASLLMAAAAIGALPPKPPEDKPEKKCLSPECPNMTQHNGGYCSADCCRTHRASKRNLNK